MNRSVVIREVGVALPKLGPRSLPFAPADTSTSCVTVLIGRNGSGKSSILRDLAVGLRDFFSGRKSGRRDQGRVSSLVIESDGRIDTLERDVHTGRLFGDHSLMNGRGLGPRKIIALSFTPFDKFPAPPLARDGTTVPENTPYVYLGFKGTARISPRALLRRSIDQLALAASRPSADTRVVDVLAAIGYEPILDIDYTINRLQKVLNEDTVERVHIEGLIARIEHLLTVRPGKMGRGLTYTFDFNRGHDANFASNRVEYDVLRQLVRANVLQIASVMLHRRTEKPVELLELSSGELNLLSGFLGLAANIEDGCVVLIDEPENSLHPEWQIGYVNMLEAVMKSHRGCHYVIATHAPLLVSGFSGRGCAILRLDQDPVRMVDGDMANASPDATLMSAFGMLTPENSYLKQLILEALSLIEQGRQRDEKAVRIASFLSSFRDELPEGGALRNLVGDVCDAILPA